MSRTESLIDILSNTALSIAEREYVTRFFDPAQTLRVIPLENSFRLGLGDSILRRTKIWNTLGHLFFEAETWDYEGGRFERIITPLCAIEKASQIQIKTSLDKAQLSLANSLQEKAAVSKQSRSHLDSLRMTGHAHVELSLSELAASLPYGSEWANKMVFNMELARISRVKEQEIWVEPPNVFDLVRMESVREVGEDIVISPRTRTFIKESLPGKPGQLAYQIVTRKNGEMVIEEQYSCETLGQFIAWQNPVSFPVADGREAIGLYFPMSTLYRLLFEQSEWSHWNFFNEPSASSLTGFARVIHMSGDAVKIRDYLGKDLSRGWLDRVSAASEWEPLPIILSAGLIPKRNAMITRRLQIARIHSNLSQLVRSGGQLCSLLIKNAWALGWTKRSMTPKRVELPFQPLH